MPTGGAASRAAPRLLGRRLRSLLAALCRLRPCSAAADKREVMPRPGHRTRATCGLLMLKLLPLRKGSVPSGRPRRLTGSPPRTCPRSSSCRRSSSRGSSRAEDELAVGRLRVRDGVVRSVLVGRGAGAGLVRPAAGVVPPVPVIVLDAASRAGRDDERHQMRAGRAALLLGLTRPSATAPLPAGARVGGNIPCAWPGCA